MIDLKRRKEAAAVYTGDPGKLGYDGEDQAVFDAYVAGMEKESVHQFDEVARLKELLHEERKAGEKVWDANKLKARMLVVARAGLEKIANEDFRGNRPLGSVDAYNCLKALKEMEHEEDL